MSFHCPRPYLNINLKYLSIYVKIFCSQVGHVICEECKERVKKQTAASTSICSICKTAPIIGRNLALERISRSLFGSK